MTDRSTSRWAAFALCCVITTALFGAWLYLGSRGCPVPDNLLTDEQLKLIRLPDPASRLEKPNCLEFWFNRYQSLIGAFIALAAAIIATIPARGQLREMLRQSSASARQSMLDLARDLEKEVGFIDKFRDLSKDIRELIDLYDNEDPEQVYQVFYSNMSQVRTKADNRLAKFRTIRARHPTLSLTHTVRTDFLQATARLVDALGKFDQAFRSMTGGIYEEYGEVELSKEEIKIARKDIGSAADGWSTALGCLRLKLLEDVEAAWTQVRSLEEQALTR